MLQAAVPDESMLEAISSTPYRPLESRDLVRSDMLNALQPVVAGIAEDRTRERMEAVLPTVRMRWRLGDAAIADLAADPAFAAIPPEALTALAGLSGIAYPDERLFDGALASLPVPLDPATRAAILDVARKRVAEPYARRQVAPIAADCGCNVGRRPNSLVYAFYPFWSFAGAEDAAPPPVDFDLVGRIAFDGLLLDAHGQLNYAAHWKDAAATFTASAHRHQAKVDLAIRLRGWRDWTDEAARLAASSVVEEMTRPHAEANLVRTPGMLGRLDRYLSRDPDGVTLIVEGYTGAARSAPGIDRLVTFVRTVAEELDDSGRTVNLAFDIPLLDPATAAAPLFQDLRGLLVDVADPERRVVEHVLVFLERPTSRAKKVLRARVESSFKGEERIQVLRALIPVVPPGANAPLEPHQSDGLVALATSETNSYGQFRDDIVYFQDNFDGIGFWPAPVGRRDPARRLPRPRRRPRGRPLLRLGAAAGAPRLRGAGPRRRRRRLRAHLSEPPALLPGRRRDGRPRRGRRGPVALQRPQPHGRAPALPRPRAPDAAPRHPRRHRRLRHRQPLLVGAGAARADDAHLRQRRLPLVRAPRRRPDALSAGVMRDPVDRFASERSARPPPSPAVRQHGLRLPAPRQAHPTVAQDAPSVACRAPARAGGVRQGAPAQAGAGRASAIVAEANARIRRSDQPEFVISRRRPPPARAGMPARARCG